MKIKPLFRGDNLSLQFGSDSEPTVAVKRCDIEIPEGEITIIYGPSGSGKSSLLNILSGLQKPTSGTLFYRYDDVYERSLNELAYFRAQELGIVYQTNYWVKSLNVIENISLPLYFLGFSRVEAHKKAQLALEKVRMSAYAKRYPILLSGGEQQRIAMARAIVDDSPVIIADEPTGNLDSNNGDAIIELLVDLNRNQGKTIILVTHNMEYLPYAHHLLQIQDGEVTNIARSDIPKTVQSLLDDVEKRISTIGRQGKTK
ncbi:MAG TPA: ABC transporter ATP-binding protein [Candidatus Saccharibacteria bacterium]|jgi:putative ABC transport system ATP-binding protein|nr:ABC transporter ATP-binding protein [Candidatus Saccharibacteria bacterium]HMT56006.1 ABC transporter ATP-binding protein [Candidatus Saccharibacteria bacterium]